MMGAYGCRKERMIARREGYSGKRARLLSGKQLSEFRQPRPRDVASRNAKEVCDEGRGVGPHGQGVYLDFADAIQRLGLETVREKYGNLFDIYQRITGEDAYTVPMQIYPRRTTPWAGCGWTTT